MKDINSRLENILRRTEKLISLQGDLYRKISELESVNQQLTGKISQLEEQLLKLKESNHNITSEQQKINNQKQREITHKINDLLSEVDQCIARLKPGKTTDSNNE